MSSRGRDGEATIMEKGSSVIPDKVKYARGFAVRKPGIMRDVEIVGSRRGTR